MSLKDYHKKRSFTKTPEPKGEEKSGAGPLSFVIQKHEATRLHYDFRLELDGVLKSWAVPKGPSLNPHDKRLAMMVEDHPIDYANFEGIIPKGNYGAGTVMVWDRGVYTPYEAGTREETEKELRKQLKAGHLTFIMLGEKLRGEFALIKTHGGEENAWILIKKGDEYASETIDILKEDKSVITCRSMKEIASQANKKQEIWYSKPKDLDVYDAPKGNMPHNIKPMLAGSADEPFDREDWVFEIKYDGYRAIAEIESGKVKLYSRNTLSYNEKFAPVVESLQKFPGNAVLDGEIVVVDELGHPRFQWVQDYPHDQGELIYYVFDILYLDGKDLTKLPLLKRKEILQEILPPLAHLKYSTHIEKAGIAMFQQAEALGIEGIMAKNGDSTYKQGRRSDDWLKIKAQNRQEVLIAGFTEPRGSRKYFGSLIAGIYKRGKLTYVGHIGTGFDEKSLKNLYEQLKPLEQKECPFETKPQTNAPATWLKPKLLAEVAFTQWTQEHQMRHPVFLGLREDKQAKELKADEPYFTKDPINKESTEIKIGKQKLELTNLYKIFYPEEKYTKGDLINYYREIAPVILPHLKDRPESLLRYPNGIKGQSFYQKDASLLHDDWFKTVSVFSESNNKNIDYLLCQDEATLIYLINLGCIDLNPWSSRVGHLEYPDYMIIDLDPEKTEFLNVVKTAQAVRKVLERYDIPSYPKTSGATGIHIYIPLGAKYTYEQSRQLGELLCLHIHQEVPEITSLERSPSKRQGKVYLDYLQNSEGQTLASVYSVRAKPGATVSTPLEWSELTTKLHPSQFTIKNIPRRIQSKGDIFKAVLLKGIDMAKILKKMQAIIVIAYIALSMAGCVNENIPAYTPSPTPNNISPGSLSIQHAKAQRAQLVYAGDKRIPAVAFDATADTKEDIELSQILVEFFSSSYGDHLSPNTFSNFQISDESGAVFGTSNTLAFDSSTYVRVTGHATIKKGTTKTFTGIFDVPNTPPVNDIFPLIPSWAGNEGIFKNGTSAHFVAVGKTSHKPISVSGDAFNSVYIKQNDNRGALLISSLDDFKPTYPRISKKIVLTKFIVQASKDEDILLKKLALRISNYIPGQYKNISLLKGNGENFGQTIANPQVIESDHPNIVFTGNELIKANSLDEYSLIGDTNIPSSSQSEYGTQTQREIFTYQYAEGKSAEWVQAIGVTSHQDAHVYGAIGTFLEFTN